MPRLLSLENRILYDVYGKLLWRFRRQPWHAAHYLAGIALPPHERFWLGVYFGDTQENNVIGSRGTSKSFGHASLAAPLKSLLFKNVTTLLLSASGFRGGKELFKDAERMHYNQLKDQQAPGGFLSASLATTRGVIQKDPSIWTLPYRSFSRYSTVPTNNAGQIRGLRANDVLVDERNTFDGTVLKTIVRPVMNVGSSFRRIADSTNVNRMYQTSTIDFTVRDWYGELQVAMDLQRREYEAHKARKQGEWREYERLMNEKEGQLKTASYSLTRFDYTDLLIPEFITTLDGQRRFRVEYPCDPGITRSNILKYDEQDRLAYFYTYPVEKKSIEQPLRDGTMDEEIFLAENRNVFIASAGNVFSFDLVQKIAERPVWQSGDAPKSKRRKADHEDDDVTEDDFYAPVLMTCGDPCILGIDVARESDETSFVVIRIGEMATGAFDPFMPQMDERGRTILGKTDWNHICWAETWKHLQAHKAAAIIRELKKRYNIIMVRATPTAPSIAGIAMDLRGGGSAVRDELGNPKPGTLEDNSVDPDWSWAKTLKIYDPEDTEGFAHYGALENPNEYWGGLRLVATQNQDNLDWTYGTRAMMQQKKLYIGYWQPQSRWAFEKGLVTPQGEPDLGHPEFVAWQVGYTGIRRLKMQLLRLQTKVTEGALIRFVMPGDRTKEEGKKDLWAALIYAYSLVREHLNSLTVQTTEVPMVEPLSLDLTQNAFQQLFNPAGPYGYPE